ncbi:hypothetical protein ACUH96_00840 [Dermabacteraceae bacterium P13077]
MVRLSKSAYNVHIDTEHDLVLIPLEKLVEALEYIGVELPAKPMTAREHLDAAWESAHRIRQGMIRGDALAIAKYGRHMEVDRLDSFTKIVFSECERELRLLDPPAPVWAEDEHIMATLPDGNTAMLQRVETGWLSYDGETYTVGQLRDVKRVNVEGESNE